MSERFHKERCQDVGLCTGVGGGAEKWASPLQGQPRMYLLPLSYDLIPSETENRPLIT